MFLHEIWLGVGARPRTRVTCPLRVIFAVSSICEACPLCLGSPPKTMNSETTRGANSRRLPLLAVPPQTASVQLSENANADVEKGRPSHSRGQDCPLTSMPLRTRRVPSAG